MNVAFTQAAEGFPRRAFTVSEVRRMMDAGVFGEDENFELVEGELVVMAAKGYAHEMIRIALTELMITGKPPGLTVASEPTLELSDQVIVEPDIAVFARASVTESASKFIRPAPGSIALCVEIASTSLRYDKLVKAGIYARHGVQEYWVIDANERTTWVHLEPRDGQWRSVVKQNAAGVLATAALPNFTVRLENLL